MATLLGLLCLNSTTQSESEDFKGLGGGAVYFRVSALSSISLSCLQSVKTHVLDSL